jgi:hypothetical protein
VLGTCNNFHDNGLFVVQRLSWNGETIHVTCCKGSERHDLSPLLFNFTVEYATEKVQEKSEGTGIKWNTSAGSL